MASSVSRAELFERAKVLRKLLNDKKLDEDGRRVYAIQLEVLTEYLTKENND